MDTKQHGPTTGPSFKTILRHRCVKWPGKQASHAEKIVLRSFDKRCVLFGEARRGLLSGGGRQGSQDKVAGELATELGVFFSKTWQEADQWHIDCHSITLFSIATRKPSVSLSRHKLQSSTTSTWQQPWTNHLKHRGNFCLKNWITHILEESDWRNLKTFAWDSEHDQQPAHCDNPWGAYWKEV